MAHLHLRRGDLCLLFPTTVVHLEQLRQLLQDGELVFPGEKIHQMMMDRSHHFIVNFLFNLTRQRRVPIPP